MSLHDRGCREERRKVSQAATSAAAAVPAVQTSTSICSAAASGPPSSDSLSYWETVAERTFYSHVHLIVESRGEDALQTSINSTPLSKLTGVRGESNVAIFFDQKISGEASSKPALRQPPFVEERYVKLVKAAIASRSGGNDTELMEGDIYMSFDAFKHGLESGLMRPFILAPDATRRCTLCPPGGPALPTYIYRD